jgi:hypothetical protein
VISAIKRRSTTRFLRPRSNASGEDACERLEPRTPLVDLAAPHTEANSLRAQLDELGAMWARKIMTASQFSAASAEQNGPLESIEQRIPGAGTVNFTVR